MQAFACWLTRGIFQPALSLNHQVSVLAYSQSHFRPVWEAHSPLPRDRSYVSCNAFRALLDCVWIGLCAPLSAHSKQTLGGGPSALQGTITLFDWDIGTNCSWQEKPQGLRVPEVYRKSQWCAVVTDITSTEGLLSKRIIYEQKQLTREINQLYTLPRPLECDASLQQDLLREILPPFLLLSVLILHVQTGHAKCFRNK